MVVFQQKCIEPLGESKSDYQIFAELSKRLGIYELFSMGGKDEMDWVKEYFAATDLLPLRDVAPRGCAPFRAYAPPASCPASVPSTFDLSAALG